MSIRTSFPRFQEYFTLIVQFKDPSKSQQLTTAKMYVGKYFTSAGEFDEVRDIPVCQLLFDDLLTQEGFARDVKRHVEKFVAGQYVEIEYNHKMD